MQSEAGLAAIVGEGDGDQRSVPGLAGFVDPRPCVNEPLPFFDLVIDAAHAVIRALLRSHAHAKGAAWAGVHLAGRHREAFRAGPACHSLGFGPRSPDTAAGSLEDARANR